MKIGDKVKFVNDDYESFFGVTGHVEKFVNSGPDEIACLDTGRIFMTKNLEVIGENKPMNKITEDCYVNVAGWTEEEVQKAAEIFAKALDAKIGNIENDQPGYNYLFKLQGSDIFVGDKDDLDGHERTEELTKEDLFGTAMEPTDDFQRAWESVWDTVCNHAPQDLFNQITQDGSGIENTVELIKTLSKHYEETTVKAGFEEFKEFSTYLDISFINGSVIVTQWPSDDVIEYSVENEEELHDVVRAFEVLGKYKRG